MSEDTATQNPFDQLTSRERQVALGLSQGHRNAEIAQELGISTKTVDTHRGHVLKKLLVRNNTELALLAVKHGIITP